jgi:hypothetical protein
MFKQRVQFAFGVLRVQVCSNAYGVQREVQIACGVQRV